MGKKKIKTPPPHRVSENSAGHYDDISQPDWSIPTPEWPIIISLRDAYHRATTPLAKRKAIKAYGDFLRLPKLR